MTQAEYIEQIKNAVDEIDIDRIIRNVLKEREMPQGEIGMAIFDFFTKRKGE